MEAHIDELLEIKGTTEKISGEIKKLKHENKTIERRCNRAEKENKLLKDRLNSIENKMLEKHVIIHGVVELEEETSKQLKEKVQEVLSHTVNMPTREERTGIACNIPIANTERIGHYNEQ